MQYTYTRRGNGLHYARRKNEETLDVRCLTVCAVVGRDSEEVRGGVLWRSLDARLTVCEAVLGRIEPLVLGARGVLIGLSHAAQHRAAAAVEGRAVGVITLLRYASAGVSGVMGPRSAVRDVEGRLGDAKAAALVEGLFGVAKGFVNWVSIGCGP